MSVFNRSELAYLRSDPGLGRLATIGADGLPHVVPLGWSYNEELDTIDIGGRDIERTQKFRNAAADPRVALLIDDVLPPWRPRAVLVRGHARTLEADGRPIIRVVPQHVSSWGTDER